MALVGDALSHVALPGIALGLLFHFNLFVGSVVFLILGALMIWFIEHKTKLSVDTLAGVLFTFALATGVLLTPREEIFEGLFGDITKIGGSDVVVASLLSLAIMTFLVILSRRLILTMISPDLSLSVGYNPHTLELFFLLIFGLTVAIGIKFVGALLMGSIIIIPAATARNVARSMTAYMWSSVILGVVGAVGGVVVSHVYHLPPGPTFVALSGGLFLGSIFLRK
jgi:zinc transport system permease protein